MLEGVRERASHLLSALDRLGLDAVGPGDLREVHRRKIGAGIPAVVEELLPLPDHAEIAVVQDQDLEGDGVLGDRAELLDVHLEAAVAGDE